MRASKQVVPSHPDQSLWTSTLDAVATAAAVVVVTAAVIELLRQLAEADKGPPDDRVRPFRAPVTAEHMRVPVA